MTSIFRSLGLCALLCCGLACVVTPEPIPVGQDAGGGVFDAIWKGDMGSAPDSLALDLIPQPPPPEGDASPIVVDGAPDGAGADGPLEGGLEGGPIEGGPPEGGLESGPFELGPTTDL